MVDYFYFFIREVDKMTISKKWYVKDLPYKTIPACEKAYKNAVKNIFDFSGVDNAEIEKIKGCVFMIFCSIEHDSENSVTKLLKKPNRIEAFYLFKADKQNKKIYDFLNS